MFLNYKVSDIFLRVDWKKIIKILDIYINSYQQAAADLGVWLCGGGGHMYEWKYSWTKY